MTSAFAFTGICSCALVAGIALIAQASSRTTSAGTGTTIVSGLSVPSVCNCLSRLLSLCTGDPLKVCRSASIHVVEHFDSQGPLALVWTPENTIITSNVDAFGSAGDRAFASTQEPHSLRVCSDAAESSGRSGPCWQGVCFGVQLSAANTLTHCSPDACFRRTCSWTTLAFLAPFSV